MSSKTKAASGFSSRALAVLVSVTGLSSCGAHDSGHGDRPAQKVADSNGDDSAETQDADVQVLTVGASRIEVRIAKEHFAASRAELVDWVRTGASSVSHVYGRFPVKRVTIAITLEGDEDEVHGTEYDGTLIRMRLGPKASKAKLDDDWTMTHEMLHLAYPNMGEEHLWMNEGLSVYLEPVARARAGIVSPARYWRELVEGLPNGQPEDGDQGLDRTHTWGRTYWGGTIFYFLADVKIREATGNRKSLDDAVRAVLDAGGDGSVTWDVKHVFRIADGATGTHVLADLYGQMARSGDRVDVESWLKKLGVNYRDGNVTFDDAAPLAGIRKAITAP